MKASLSTTLIAAALAATTLAACDRNDDRTVGQRVDGAVTSAERGAERAGAEVRSAGERVAQATENAADAVGDKAKDAAITTSVNAELAKDEQLSALRIDVDTSGGRVALNGTAPSAEARERATRLAMNVDGVRAVDNNLTVRQ